MKIIRTIDELKRAITEIQAEKKSLGFVPTMGALHEGHLSLVQKAAAENDVVAVSIFVNPTQFNNSEDLQKYPRSEEKDLALLKKEAVHLVFLPEIEEIYPENLPKKSIDLGFLGETLEGKFRPGHFEGVVNVVSRLFDLIEPQKAYFGRKDFQQLAVIQKMVKELRYPIEIVGVKIARNEHGLALSSRNQRLSEQELKDAVILSHALEKGKDWACDFSPSATLAKMKEILNEGRLELEYLEVVDPTTLRSLYQYWVPGATACIAAYCGKVRLIDNMELVPLEKN